MSEEICQSIQLLHNPFKEVFLKVEPFQISNRFVNCDFKIVKKNGKN